MLRLVEGLAAASIMMEQVSGMLPASKTLWVEGVYEDQDELWAAIQAQLGKPDENRKRWHLADPVVEGSRTWVLNNNWGDKTRDLFKELLAVAPPGFDLYEEGEIPESLV